MFNKVEFRKEATPKRVYAFLKLINYKNGELTEKEVYEYMQPKTLTKSQDAIQKVVCLCSKEGFIKEDSDKKFKLNIDSKYLKSEEDFRDFIGNKLYNDSKMTIFADIARHMLSAEMNIYDITGYKNLAAYFRKATSITEEAILAWRFWGTFIGYGFMLNGQFVINPYKRIEFIIRRDLKNNYDKLIEIGDFLELLVDGSNDFKAAINENEISIPVSIALKTLEELGIVTLENIKDSETKWIIRYEGGVYFTHIRINGGTLNG